MIEMYMLRQLVAIADYGTISKAAAELHLSQPAISRTINKLEEIMQVQLFDRGKNRISLNENGELAVEYARKVLEASELMVERVRSFDESKRTISVCSCAPSPLWLIIPILSELYSNMKISSEMKYHDDLANELLDGHCHILITPEEIDLPDIICHQFFTESLYLSVPPAHPLAGYPEVSLNDLEGESMLLFSDLGYWRTIGERMKNTNFIFQNELDSMSKLIKLSALPAFSSDLTINYDRDINRIYIPVKDDAATATFYCCWKKSDFKRFKELAKHLKTRNEA